MKRSCILIIITFCAFALKLAAIPAREGLYTLRQPDGSTLRVKLKGDEFCRILTTEDGCAIGLDRDGYYRYASYDAAGKRHTGTYRADRPAPASVMNASRNIPYGAISRAGAERRASARRAVRPVAFPAVKSASKQRGLVILAQFKNLQFKNSRARFEALLNEPDYRYNNATGCAAEYFNEQFKGLAEFEFDVSEIVTLSHDYAYYGANVDDFDGRPGELVAEACRLADNSIDFSKYDYDGDGQVNNVFVFVAGKDEAHGAGEDYIWSHAWSLYDGARINLNLDGKKINSYAISTEYGINSSGQHIFTGIGSFCHEFSHTLGLADLYDTDYDESGGKSKALWSKLSLMDGGCYNNDSNTPPNYCAVDRYQLGIGVCETLSPGAYSLEPIGRNGRYGIVEGDLDGECYLFESRANEGWDKYIGVSGMLIYHVDMSENLSGWSDKYSYDMTAKERWYYNEVNCNPDHQCAELIEASANATSIAQTAWPYGKSTSFKPNSTPAFRFWSGAAPEVSVTEIEKSSDGVSFVVTGPLSINETEAFQNAAIVQWSCSIPDVTCTVSCNGKNIAQVDSYGNGEYSYTLEGLSPKTRYDIIISAPEIQSAACSISTMSMYSDGYPFIYMGSTEKNSDGSIAKGSHISLRVFNCSDVRDISWSLDGKTIKAGDDGYYTLNASGSLKAEIHYNDGGTETISKKLTVK